MTRFTHWRAATVVTVICVAATGAVGRSQQSRSSAPASQVQTPPTVPAARAAAASRSTDYRIGPEDVLEIAVWKNEALTRTVPVRPDGKISLPFLNDVQASGMTPIELRDVVTKGYSVYVPEPEVSVIVREIHSIKVSIVGLVKTPGRYELKSQATVLDALALAGGLTDFAKRDRIFVMRKRQPVRIPFNYARMLDAGDEENFLLESGDIVVVP